MCKCVCVFFKKLYAPFTAAAGGTNWYKIMFVYFVCVCVCADTSISVRGVGVCGLGEAEYVNQSIVAYFKCKVPFPGVNTHQPVTDC